jgi:hypothetical protein
MWLAQFVCAPQFLKTPSGLFGHTAHILLARITQLSLIIYFLLEDGRTTGICGSISSINISSISSKNNLRQWPCVDGYKTSITWTSHTQQDVNTQD